MDCTSIDFEWTEDSGSCLSGAGQALSNSAFNPTEERCERTFPGSSGGPLAGRPLPLKSVQSGPKQSSSCRPGRTNGAQLMG